MYLEKTSKSNPERFTRQQIETFLTDQKLITNEYIITESFIDFLCNEKFKLSRIRELFISNPSVNSPAEYDIFTVKRKCPSCNKIEMWKTGKTALLAHIQNQRKNKQDQLLCAPCQKRHDKQERKNYKKGQKELEIKNKVNRRERSESFLNNHLNPECQWNKGTPIWEQINELKSYYQTIDRDEVFWYIRDMPYKDFLKTPYWKAIATHARKKAGWKCQLCSNEGELHVHHPNYDILGKELKHLSELIVLCYACHGKFHNVVKEAIYED